MATWKHFVKSAQPFVPLTDTQKEQYREAADKVSNSKFVDEMSHGFPIVDRAALGAVGGAIGAFTEAGRAAKDIGWRSFVGRGNMSPRDAWRNTMSAASLGAKAGAKAGFDPDARQYVEETAGDIFQNSLKDALPGLAHHFTRFGNYIMPVFGQPWENEDRVRSFQNRWLFPGVEDEAKRASEARLMHKYRMFSDMYGEDMARKYFNGELSEDEIPEGFRVADNLEYKGPDVRALGVDWGHFLTPSAATSMALSWHPFGFASKAVSLPFSRAPGLSMALDPVVRAADRLPKFMRPYFGSPEGLAEGAAGTSVVGAPIAEDIIDTRRKLNTETGRTEAARKRNQKGMDENYRMALEAANTPITPENVDRISLDMVKSMNRILPDSEWSKTIRADKVEEYMGMGRKKLARLFRSGKISENDYVCFIVAYNELERRRRDELNRVAGMNLW